MADGKKLKPGDKVAWKHSQGTTVGRVKKRLTSETTVGGTTVKASEDDPRFLVESDATGAEAAHTAKALRKRS